MYFLSNTSLRPSAFLLPLTHFPSLSPSLCKCLFSLSHTHTLSISRPHRKHPEKSSFKTEQQLHCHPKLFRFFLPGLFSCFLWTTVEARIARSKKSAPRDCVEQKESARERGKEKVYKARFWRKCKKEAGESVVTSCKRGDSGERLLIPNPSRAFENYQSSYHRRRLLMQIVVEWNV